MEFNVTTDRGDGYYLLEGVAGEFVIRTYSARLRLGIQVVGDLTNEGHWTSLRVNGHSIRVRPVRRLVSDSDFALFYLSPYRLHTAE